MPPKKSNQNYDNKIKKLPMKTKQKRHFFRYDETVLQKALIEINAGNMSINRASQEFNVPKTTIIDRMKGRSSENKRKTGPEPLLSRNAEIKLKEWVVNIAKCGFPLKKTDLLETVEKIAKDLGKSHLFKDGKPGQKWYMNFLKRHSEISLREAESVNRARAVITEQYIRAWFRDLKAYLETNKLNNIMTNGEFSTDSHYAPSQEKFWHLEDGEIYII